MDTCPSGTTKFGPICAGSDGTERSFDDAINYCADLGLRLPSYSEAVALGRNYDVPGVGFTELFWTDEEFFYNTAFGTQSSLMKTELDTRPLKMSSRRT